ncbi:hypothetical protein [uncultured Endozoicomonas sp.]|uniref:hypothetical protein n=1 Tax=uncultured Endozoicomonas sp. TaxID=432652 RepID=UPI0026374793|nr:hypothetical protein [uncultured Endozoicomonas sp.]
MKEFIEKVPHEILARSGSVFYSGKESFQGNKELYILGLNPGGLPTDDVNESISFSITEVLENRPSNWSAYRDESWEGAEPGTWRMQPRILHLLNNLDIDPGNTPSSNVIFVRSEREKQLKSEVQSLLTLCWSFHDYVIKELKPKAILCLGKTAGLHARNKLSANTKIDEFVENNNRKWCSEAFTNGNGIKVIVATHPSIADWTVKNTDPSNMIRRVLSTKA